MLNVASATGAAVPLSLPRHTMDLCQPKNGMVLRLLVVRRGSSSDCVRLSRISVTAVEGDPCECLSLVRRVLTPVSLPPSPPKLRQTSSWLQSTCVWTQCLTSGYYCTQSSDQDPHIYGFYCEIWRVTGRTRSIRVQLLTKIDTRKMMLLNMVAMRQQCRLRTLEETILCATLGLSNDNIAQLN